MLATLQFPSEGCWMVSATYQGVMLRFVVWVGSTEPGAPASTPALIAAPLLLAAERRQMTRSWMWGLSRKPMTWSQGGSG